MPALLFGWSELGGLPSLICGGDMGGVSNTNCKHNVSFIFKIFITCITVSLMGMLGGFCITTVWHILGLQMDEKASTDHTLDSYTS